MTATFPNILLLALVGFACAQLLHSSCRDLPSRPSCKLAPPRTPPRTPKAEEKKQNASGFSAAEKHVVYHHGFVASIYPHTHKKKTPVNRDHHLEF